MKQRHRKRKTNRPSSLTKRVRSHRTGVRKREDARMKIVVTGGTGFIGRASGRRVRSPGA